MAKILNWNAAAFEAACVEVGMNMLEEAANIIAENMKTILAPQVTGMQKITGKDSTRYEPWPEHGEYETGEAAGQKWTARHKNEMIKTIRVRRKNDSASRNIWILAGNFKVWWALQMEYGKGGWKGGRKSFMRPAMRKAPAAIIAVLEGGSGQTKGFGGYL